VEVAGLVEVRKVRRVGTGWREKERRAPWRWIRPRVWRWTATVGVDCLDELRRVGLAEGRRSQKWKKQSPAAAAAGRETLAAGEALRK
jgi:hypothetical protein